MSKRLFTASRCFKSDSNPFRRNVSSISIPLLRMKSVIAMNEDSVNSLDRTAGENKLGSSVSLGSLDFPAGSECLVALPARIDALEACN